MKVFLLSITLLVVATAPPVLGNDPVKIAVSPIHSFAPSLVRVRVRVEPSHENRMLQIIADGENFYRRSDVQLEGDQSPATTQMELRNLPGGEYEVKAVLIDSNGRERAVARAQATVLSPRNSPSPGMIPQQ
jgi:hypothetical protein